MINKSSDGSTATHPVIVLDSISVCAEDLGETAAFLSDVMGWKQHPVNFAIFPKINSPSTDAVFVDGNGVWLQLVSAKDSEDNRVIDRKNGTFFKLNFSTCDYDLLQQSIQSKAAEPIHRAGPETISLSLNSGQSISQRIASYATAESQKVSFDIYDNNDDSRSSIIAGRDNDWAHRERDRNVPRIDRIAIIVQDIEASIDFYTRVLGLTLNPMESSVTSEGNENIGGFRPAFIFANSVWLVLIQPLGDGPLMETLIEKGDGHILEVITEVDDLAAFYDKMKLRGITLLCVDGKTPLNDNQKSQTLEPFGDKLAYLPTEVSQGMVIEIFERGPRETSLIHQRDIKFSSL